MDSFGKLCKSFSPDSSGKPGEGLCVGLVPDLQRIAGYAETERNRVVVLLIINLIKLYFTNHCSNLQNNISHYHKTTFAEINQTSNNYLNNESRHLSGQLPENLLNQPTISVLRNLSLCPCER